MYEYKFIKLQLGGFMVAKPNKDYRKIIRAQAKEGWRFKQIFAPGTNAYGSASYFELIFEKKIE